MGVDVNAAAFTGYTPLIAAVMLGWPEVIPILINAGANLEHHWNGLTALNFACQKLGLEHSVRILLKFGADIHAGGNNQSLKDAICAGSVETISLLLQYGALLYPGALHDAATSGHPAVVEELVKMGMNIDEIYQGKPVLHVSLRGGARTLHKLLDLGANVNIADANGITASMLAVTCANEELLELLVKCGADLEAMNVFGRTVLAMAVTHRNYRWIAKLIDLGANLRTKLTGRRSILSEAIVHECSSAVVELLIQRGAELDHPDHQGFTPLMIATELQSITHLEILLKYQPHISSLPEAMSIAQQYGFRDVIDRFYKHVEMYKVQLLISFLIC